MSHQPVVQPEQRRNHQTLKIMLAVLLPPLAVYMAFGNSRPFWISILLTALLWVPGIIHAMFLVLKTLQPVRDRIFVGETKSQLSSRPTS